MAVAFMFNSCVKGKCRYTYDMGDPGIHYKLTINNVNAYRSDIYSAALGNIYRTRRHFLPRAVQPQWGGVAVAVIWSETLVSPTIAQWLLTGHIKCLLMASKSFTLRQTQSHRWGFVFSPYNRTLGTNLTSDICNINTNKTCNIKLYQSRTLAQNFII